jgi:hypothetical protein
VTAPRIPLGEQMRELTLTIGETDAALSRMVSNNKMRASERDYRMSRLYAVKRTLEWLISNEAQIKAKLADRQEVSSP